MAQNDELRTGDGKHSGATSSASSSRSGNSIGSTSTSRVERRYWQRVPEPVKPWWPRGLLPLLALLLLFLWGLFRTAPHIQAETEATVAQHLREQNIATNEVEADGQIVRVAAPGLAADEGRIRAIAKSTECETWAGLLTCPTTVDVALAKPKPEPQAAPAGAAVPAPVDPIAPAEPVVRFHNFQFSKLNNSVVLSGEVPSMEARSKIMQWTLGRFDSVDDQLRVSGQRATGDYLNAAQRAALVLENIGGGNARWQDGVFSATGDALVNDEAAIRSAFNATADAPPLGELSLTISKGVDQCNEAFGQALAESTINFRTSSAEIQDSSAALLTRLAELANQCPGTLAIEGHTDSVGGEQMNQALSQSRAQAVVAALVGLKIPANRLQAIGYGESRPIADNATPSGRAQNRRIVIKIAE